MEVTVKLRTDHAKERRERTLKRLKEQLASGKKPWKNINVKDGATQEDLTEADIKRIKKEIAILETRV
jgi:hypothetical protein